MTTNHEGFPFRHTAEKDIMFETEIHIPHDQLYKGYDRTRHVVQAKPHPD